MILFHLEIRRGHGLLQRAGHRRFQDPASNGGSGLGKRDHVISIKTVEQLVDALVQPALRQKFAISVRGSGKTAGHVNACTGQAADHFAQRRVLAANPGDIFHAQLFEPDNVVSHVILLIPSRQDFL
jgi:hypothetical protein